MKVISMHFPEEGFDSQYMTRKFGQHSSNNLLPKLFFATSYFEIFSLREPPKFTKLTNLMIFKSDTVISNNTVHSFSRNKSC